MFNVQKSLFYIITIRAHGKESSRKIIIIIPDLSTNRIGDSETH